MKPRPHESTAAERQDAARRGAWHQLPPEDAPPRLSAGASLPEASAAETLLDLWEPDAAQAPTLSA